MEQRTEEWYSERLGKVTASKVHDVVNRLKSGGYSAARDKYMMELLCERLSGKSPEFFTSKAMQRGIDLEPVAKMAYWMKTGKEVSDVGFVPHPRLKNVGASPDGMVLTTGLIEIKCPETHTHVRFLMNQEIDPQYLSQMHLQMGCTGRQWCDFVSFDDRLPEPLQLGIKRVKRDPEILKKMYAEIRKFLSELEHIERQMRKLSKRLSR